jgi:hypothetical protein
MDLFVPASFSHPYGHVLHCSHSITLNISARQTREDVRHTTCSLVSASHMATTHGSHYPRAHVIILGGHTAMAYRKQIEHASDTYVSHPVRAVYRRLYMAFIWLICDNLLSY